MKVASFVRSAIPAVVALALLLVPSARVFAGACSSPCFSTPDGACPDVTGISVTPIEDNGSFKLRFKYRGAHYLTLQFDGSTTWDCTTRGECIESWEWQDAEVSLSTACWSPGVSHQIVISIENCIYSPKPPEWRKVVYGPTITAPANSKCDNPVGVPDGPPLEKPEVCELNGKDPKCSNCTGSPCYVASGTYETIALDLQVPTNGFPLTVGRVYESAHAIDGPLGPGWTSSLDSRVYYTTATLGSPTSSQTTSFNEAEVVLPDGTHRTFRAPSPVLPTSEPITFAPPVGRSDTLVRNADGTWDLAIQHSASVYHFDTNGRLETMTDDFGNRLRLTYDGAGRIQRMADESGSGRYLDVYWGPNGRIADVTDNTGRIVHYDYDGTGALTRAVDPENRGTNYLYTEGRYAPVLSGIRDPWGRAITDLTWEKNSSDRPTGRLQSYTEEGETYSYTYENGQTIKTDSSGHTWTFPYQDNDLITQRQGPDGTSGTVYDAAGRVTESTDPAGIRTQYGWTAAGVLASVTQAPGTADQVRYEYGYDANFPWKVTSVVPKDPATSAVDRDWQETRYEYYPLGAGAPGSLHKVLRVKSDGSSDVVTTYEYDARGRVTRVLDAHGSATDYAYDTAGNLATVTRPTNDDLGTRPSVTYGYDSLGRVTTITEGQAVTLLTYDKIDRVTQTKVQKNASCVGGEVCEFVTGVLYDQYEAGYARLWVHQTDANGIVTKQAYDTYGRLVVSRDAQNNDTRYNYAKKHLVGITDANDYTTGYLYDSAGRLSKTIFPDAAEESYTYSADGLLATKTDRKGNVIGYLYDAHKRLKQKTYNNGADGTITFVYEGQKLTRVENRSQGVNEDHVYTYDAGYRTASEQQGPRGTVRWEYDTRDQVSRMSVDGGPTTDYTYYPDGSMNTITWSLVLGQFKYRYTPEGQYATVTFPNGQSRNYSYDWAGRLLQLANLHPTAGNLATYSYGYDVDWATGLKTKKGQRTSMTADVPAQGFSGSLTKYLYDQNYQLAGADYPAAAPFNGEVARWAYDAIGNRTSQTVNGVTTNYTYQKLGANPKNWERLLSDQQSSISYDPNGSVNAVAGSSTLGISYDFDGRTLAIGSDVFTYDWKGRAVSRNGVARLWDSHDLLNGDPQSTWVVHGFGIDMPMAFSDGTATEYAIVDIFHSVSGTFDGQDSNLSGAYDAWGTNRSPSTGQHGFAFSGRERLAGDAVHLRLRVYASRFGRFLSTDPIGYEGGGRNLYEYVRNEPLSRIDPLGLCGVDVQALREITPPVNSRIQDFPPCHGTFSCTNFTWIWDCQCKNNCPSGKWQMDFKVSLQPIMYLPNRRYNPEMNPFERRGHEHQHVQDVTRRVESYLNGLHAIQYQDEPTCTQNCDLARRNMGAMMNIFKRASNCALDGVCR